MLERYFVTFLTSLLTGILCAVQPWMPDLPETFSSGRNVPSLDVTFPRAVAYAGESSRFEGVFARALREEPLTLVVMGGSITAGARSTNPSSRSWGAQFADGWRRAFPHSKITFRNAGIGATGSAIGAFRVIHDVLAFEPDVVGLEFSVNDPNIPVSAETMEGLVRTILKTSPKTAIFMLGMMNKSGGSAQTQHLKIAQKYGLPYISYRDALRPEVVAKHIDWSDLAPDAIHPNDIGHAYAAALVNRFLAGRFAAFRTASRAPDSIPAIPKPLIGTAYDDGRILDWNQVRILSNEGFDVPAKEPYWGTGLAATNASARLVVEIDAPTAALLYRRGRKPYGLARVSVDGKVVYPRLEGFADQWWWYTPCETLFRNRSGRHTVEIVTLAEKAEKSEGFGFQVCAFMTSGGQSDEKTSDSASE